MIKIQFCLKDSEGVETILTDMKLPSNPFKVGDKVNLSLNSLRKDELIGYVDSYKETIKNKHELFMSSVHLKTAILTEEKFFLDIDLLNNDSLSISYYCEIID